MNNEMQRVWEALRLIYGMDLTAATLVVLTKDGETGVNFQTFYFPQKEAKNDQDIRNAKALGAWWPYPPRANRNHWLDMETGSQRLGTFIYK